MDDGEYMQDAAWFLSICKCFSNYLSVIENDNNTLLLEMIKISIVCVKRVIIIKLLYR